MKVSSRNFSKFKYVIVYLGKNGKQLLEDSLSKFDFQYKEKNSLTSDDSIMIKITNLKKI